MLKSPRQAKDGVCGLADGSSIGVVDRATWRRLVSTSRCIISRYRIDEELSLSLDKAHEAENGVYVR